MENVFGRFDQLVELLEGHGELEPEKMRPTIERAYQSCKPSCVNVVTTLVASPKTMWISSPSVQAQRMAFYTDTYRGRIPRSKT
jgi:hypothetical protein